MSMITSIFSKSKPINFLIVAILVIAAFGFHVYLRFNDTDFSIFTSGFSLFIVLFYIFLTDFIISKNDLTKRSSYGIMLFSLLVVIFPEILSDINLLISNLLVLFALRRLFSLHTKRSLKKKFFDAVFWIALASLFYTWAILFLVVVVISLSFYWQNEGKYIAISFFAVVAVFVLLVLYNIILKDQFLPESNFNFNFSLDFSNYNSPYKIVRFTIIIAVFLWSLIFYFKNTSEGNKKLKPIHALVVFSSIIALIIAFLAAYKIGNEVVFFMLPFVIIVANYLETIEENWFREVFVGLLVLIPILSLLL